MCQPRPHLRRLSSSVFSPSSAFRDSLLRRSSSVPSSAQRSHCRPLRAPPCHQSFPLWKVNVVNSGGEHFTQQSSDVTGGIRPRKAHDVGCIDSCRIRCIGEPTRVFTPRLSATDIARSGESESTIHGPCRRLAI